MAQVLTEQDIASATGSERYWTYNGLDCMVTEEVRAVLAALLARDPAADRTHRFELACQSPAFTMMLRGVAIDEFAAARAVKEWERIEEEAALLARSLLPAGLWDRGVRRPGKCEKDGKPHRWTNSVVEWRKHRKVFSELNLPADPPLDADATCVKCGCPRLTEKPFNPRSAPDVIHLLYDLLRLPHQYTRKEHRLTGNEEALEKLIHMEKTDDEVIEVLRAIVHVHKAHKQIGFLRSRRSADGRLRSSVNVGATEVDRWSASKDPFREGTNFQNIADRSRNIIVADPGLWIGYADLEQAESKIVAFDSEDEGYIAAHEAGDVHTAVARMVWPELPWTGDREEDREIADQRTPWDPDHSYRDYAKHVQHGGNIGQSPFGMSRDAHIPLKQAKEVYERMYGQAFPNVRRRQKEIKAAVAETGVLTTPLGRRRQFFGRLWDPATQREGMAETQQSMIAHLLNVALWHIWRELDTGVNVFNAPRPSDPNRVWLLAQVHDAILFELRPHDLKTLQRVLELMTVPVLIRGRVCKIAVDVQLGQNFRHFDPKKPETVGGLAGWHVEGEKIVVHNTREYLKCA